METSGSAFVIGIDPGVPREKAPAAFSVLRLDRTGAIGLVQRATSLKKPELAELLRNDPLLGDERLRLAALNAPLTPVRLERKPLRARKVEIRLSRGAFAGSVRGPHPTWISAARSGWLRYLEAAQLSDILRQRGLPLLAMPPDGVAPELPERCSVEVFAKVTLAVLAPLSSLVDRPLSSEIFGQIDDWLFPRLFLPPESGERAPIEDLLEARVPGLHFTPETLLEADRITLLRRPFPRREPMRAFVAALQGILALEGAAALVGAEGETEGSYVMPAEWHPDWEEAWIRPLKRDPGGVRRVKVLSQRGR